MKSKTKNLQLKLGGLSCSFCASSIETAFQGEEGVKKVSVSLSHNEMLAHYDPMGHGCYGGQCKWGIAEFLWQ